MHRRIFDRTFIVRFLVSLLAATLIVVVPLVLLARQQTNEQITRAVAKERVERTIADCQQANEERIAFIATSEALIRIATSSSPEPLSPRDRLLIAAFVQKADKQIESVTKPKVCTIKALGLQQLAGIAQISTTVPATTPSAPPATSKTTVPRRHSNPPPAPVHTSPPATPHITPPHNPHTTTTLAPPAALCVKRHGKCPPKG